MLTVAIVAWALLCILALAQPFLTPVPAPAGPRQESPTRTNHQRLLEEKRALYRELRDLELDHATGKLSAEDYRVQRERLVGSAAQILKTLEQIGPSQAKPAAPPPAAPGGAVAAPTEAAPETRFCTACGTARAPDDRFCRHCGKALA